MNLRIAAELCVAFEGIVLKPYLCPANVWTIGVGSTRYLDGRAVTKDDPPITQRQAMELLEQSLRKIYAPAVARLCPKAVEHDGRFNALVDFAFNLGPGALASSTLRRRINEERWSEAADEFAKWNKGGGRVLPGLVKRRAAERALFLAGG